MRRYKHYKDSGIEWIGEIPEHWNTLRLRFVCELRNGYTPSKANPDFWSEGTIPWYRMEDIRESGRRLNEAKQYITESAIKGGGLFEAGSFIMATTATIGEHAVLIVDSLANQQFTNLKIRKSLSHSDFNAFFFQYLFVVDDYCKTTTKTATFPAVNMEDLKNFIVCIPPLDEQKIILTYLDKKCGLIDRMISNLQKKIELLKELKSSVISQAVTKGLDPHVKMKDSGVEWIEEIPEHWEIERFKRYLREPLKYGANEAAESDCKYWPRYIRITDIDENGKLREETFKSLSPEKARDYILKKGDILFARSGATVGKTYIYNSDSPACYAGYLIRAECNENLYSNFIYYYTKSGVYENWKNSISIQSTIQNIGADKYSLMPVILPPLPEQQSIANYLDKKCEKIDSTVTKAQRKIDLLKEYKTALISEVVTGKRRVSA